MKNNDCENFDKLYIGKSKINKNRFKMYDGVLTVIPKMENAKRREEFVKIVIPEKLVEKLMHEYHCKSKAHFSRDELMRRITCKYEIDDVWQNVKNFECKICDANTRTAKSKVPIGKYPLAVHPFEELNFVI